MYDLLVDVILRTTIGNIWSITFRPETAQNGSMEVHGMKDEDIKITAEEKEMLRRLMETPGIEKEWDFFKGLNMDVPPPEFFMRGDPDPPAGDD